jgi:hypothetical protein
MFNPISKIDAEQAGLDADLLEAAKKCQCMENDPYNPSGAGPARLPSEPSSSGQKMSITDEKKKIKKEAATTDSMRPGYVKMDRGYA